jgi:hypothetical protein
MGGSARKFPRDLFPRRKKIKKQQCSTKFLGHGNVGAGERIPGTYGSTLKILGNVIGDVGAFDIGDTSRSRHTKKLKLKHMSIET